MARSSTTVNTNGDRALVMYEAADSHANTSSNGPETDASRAGIPRDLIVHETMKLLVNDIIDLKERCDLLAADNKEYAKRLVILERALLADKITKEALARHHARNVTGYDSSDSEDTERSQGTAFTSEIQKAIFQLFEHHESRISDNAQHLQDLDARFTANNNNSVNEPSTAPSRLKQIEARLNMLDARVMTRPITTDSPTDPYFIDQMERMSEKIQELETKLEVFSAVADADQNTCSAGSKNKERGFTGVPSEFAVPMKFLKDDIDELKKSHQHIQAQRDMEQLIDDASTRDVLYGMYHELTNIMKDDGYRRRAVRFEGTFDELLTLRSRVLRRLATFDAWCDALKEARDAEVC